MNLTTKNKIEYNEIPEYLRYKTNNLQDPKREYLSNVTHERKLRALFTFATQHLYNSLLKTLPSLNEKKVVVTGSVRCDGVGDYYHITHTAEQIKKAYPHLKMDVIPMIMASPFPSLQLLDAAKFETLLCSEKAISEQALKKIKESHLVFEVSQNIYEDEYNNIIKEKDEAHYEFIGEYAYGAGMGVEDIELGIAIKEMPSSHSLLDLENSALKQILFNTDQPSKDDLDNYLKNHEPFMAYLKAGSFYQIGLIYTIVALQENSPKNFIDICIPQVDLSILNLDYLKNHGVGKITVIKNSNGSIVENPLKLAEEGKELRFINPYPLNQNDFYTFMLHSHPLVGCTGDHSLSEVLSFNRMPFYEIRSMKRGFWQGMLKLAGEVGGEAHYLQQYFKELFALYLPYQDAIINYYRKFFAGQKMSLDKEDEDELNLLKRPEIAQAGERMAKLLQTPEIYEEMAQLSALLKQHYNFNPFIKDMTARKFVLQTYPELQQYEKELYNQFMAKEMDIVAVNTLLKQKIDAYQ